MLWEEEGIKSSRFNKILDASIIFLFALTFFSIPAFSFHVAGKNLTWVFTVLLLLLIAIDLLLFYEVKIDIIAVSAFGFALSSLISSALNLFRTFKITPILMGCLLGAIYVYLRSAKGKIKTDSFFLAAFLGDLVFLAMYMYEYRHELISLDFNRLGNLFGDINDVSLFLSYGFAYSVTKAFDFRNKGRLWNLFWLMPCLPFLFCGLTTGSKILIVIDVVVVIYAVFHVFENKRKWIAALIIAGLAILFIALLNLPFLSSLKERVDDFLFTMLGLAAGTDAGGDMSTLNRLDMFFTGTELWLRRPIFGWGIWGFATYSGRGGWSHNSFSELLCNYGIIGFILFVTPIVISIKNYLRPNNQSHSSISFSILLFFACTMFSISLETQKMYALLAGTAFASINDCKPIWAFTPRIILDRFKRAKVNA